MLVIAETDTRPVEAFPLAWRWHGDPSSPIPAVVLDTIRCLTESKASEVWNSLRTHVATDQFSSTDFSTIRFLDPTSDVAVTRSWLRDLPVASGTKVVLSWEPDAAVVIPWPAFVDYWDDFCYPSSDDLVVAPFNLGWLLAYWHFERFDFAVRASQAAA